MKMYVHARLTAEDQAILEDLKRSTGRSGSELVRRGLRLALEEQGRRKSAKDLAGRSVGKFEKGPRDLAANKGHLADFGR